ncbi:hypothetical protein ONZ45_g10811 [Pleurotus djamor]|nr:hypothetical protein ONZ45_g10811 [Pleurotus djamor]
MPPRRNTGLPPTRRSDRLTLLNSQAPAMAVPGGLSESQENSEVYDSAIEDGVDSEEEPTVQVAQPVLFTPRRRRSFGDAEAGLSPRAFLQEPRCDAPSEDDGSARAPSGAYAPLADAVPHQENQKICKPSVPPTGICTGLSVLTMNCDFYYLF